VCGIYGVATPRNLSDVATRFDRLGSLLCHRGPDGKGEWAEKQRLAVNIWLGHHRLAINDLDSRATQPLRSEAGSSIVVNGEIYNSSALRGELADKFKFKTNSDSEVALAVLEIYGQQGISKLDGMFAFAFVPANGAELWLGRDRLGIKPLYFSREMDNFWFSSEAQPLAKTLNKPLDDVALEEWSVYQFVVSDRSMFEGVFPVPAGHLVILKNGRTQHKKYWNFDDFLPSNSGHDDNAVNSDNQIKKLLSAAVNSHLLSDVEIVTLTSGGIDSSLVSALASKNGVRKAFVGRYDFEGFDESSYAQSVAEQSNLNLSIVTIDEQMYFDELDRVSSHIDYPSAGPGSIGQSLVAKEISKVAKVVLSGTGGDELFLGYVRDRFPLLAAGIIDASHGKDSELWACISGDISNFSGYSQMLGNFVEGRGFQSPLLGFLRTVTRSTHDGIFRIASDSFSRIESELLTKIAPNGASTVSDVHESLLRYEMKHFLPSLLHIEDRISMAHGLESRVPLLDTSFVEFTLGLPLNLRIGGNRPKDVLRRISKPLLPQSVLNRQDKMGFPVPLHNWARKKSFKRVEETYEILSSSDLPIINKRNLVSPSHLVAGTGRELWGAITLGAWLKTL
jgi:asparagine synthase (glutamine-hydrolysing)